MSYQITITDAGRQALVNAENTGSAPLVISELAFGTGAYEPDGSETALQAETKRVNTLAGSAVGDGIIHLTVRDESNDSYSVNEFGLFTNTGVLFAVYAQIGDPIIIKSVSSALLLAIDMAFVDVDTASITFGDTNFSNPPATGTTPGIVRFQQHLMETSPFVAMRPGAFGLGGHMPIADANLAVLAGFYSCLAGTPNTPIADRAGVLIVAQGGEDTAGVHQTWCLSHGADQGLRYERHYSTSHGWSEWMETGGSNTITLDGPALIYPGTSNDYVITNYDAFSTYTAAISAGATVTLVDELLTIDVALDTEPTDLTLTLSRNDKERAFAIEVGPVGIVTPAIESPIDGATDVIETSTVYSSPYATYPPDFDTHASSDWQIATDAAFTDVVFESLGDADNLTSWPIDYGALEYLASYYVRVRYRSAVELISEWSVPSIFTVRDDPLPKNETTMLDSNNNYKGHMGTCVVLSPSGNRLLTGRYEDADDNSLASTYGQFNGVVNASSRKNIFGTSNFYGRSIAISAENKVLLSDLKRQDLLNGSRRIRLLDLSSSSSLSFFDHPTVPGTPRWGWSLAISDLTDVITIGSPTDASVCIYTKDGSSYPLLSQIFAPDDGIDSSGFGEHISMNASGTQFIVHVTNRTVAYVYTIENGSVTLTQTLIPSVSNLTACGGGVISPDGSTIVLAAVTGSAIVFKKIGGIFIESQILSLGAYQLAGLYDACNQISISSDGSVLLIGCGESRCALIFTRVNETYLLGATLTPSVGNSTDKYGRSTALQRDGKVAVVGAPDSSFYATLGGAAYVYA